MHRCVERAHAAHHIGRCAGRGQAHVDHRDLTRDLGGAGQDLAQCVKALRAEYLHAADPQFGQKHHGHDDNPDTAEPLQQPAPQQQAARQLLKIREHRRPGGGQPRHRLEKRIDEPRLGGPEIKRQRPENRQRQPDPGGQQKRLLNAQPRPDPVRGRQRAQPADQNRDRARLQENQPMPGPVLQIDRHGDQHGQPQDRRQGTDDIGDRSQVKHRPKAWPGRCEVSSRRSARRGAVAKSSADAARHGLRLPAEAAENSQARRGAMLSPGKRCRAVLVIILSDRPRGARAAGPSPRGGAPNARRNTLKIITFTSQAAEPPRPAGWWCRSDRRSR